MSAKKYDKDGSRSTNAREIDPQSKVHLIVNLHILPRSFLTLCDTDHRE